MNDLISRQGAIDAFMEEVPSYGLMDADGNIVSGCKDSDVIAMLEQLPSEQSEPNWIPCSERLPEICANGLSKLVWACERYGDGTMWQSIDQCTADGAWMSEVPFDDPCDRCKVIAWMPLPEPYQAERING